jgi:hypothetical protein
MSFIDCIRVLFFDVIIITLAVKTKLYAKILIIINRLIPYIVMGFILLAPLCSFVLLIIICDIFVGSVASHVVKTVNEYNMLMDLKEFGLNCIMCSPAVLLIFCFLFQSNFVNNERNKGQGYNEMLRYLLRMKISILINDLTILAGIIFLFVIFHVDINIFGTKLVKYIQNYPFADINFHSEYLIQMVLMILLGIFYYVIIFSVSNYFVDAVIYYNNEINKNSKLKTWKYILLTFFPLINVLVIYILSKKIYNKST